MVPVCLRAASSCLTSSCSASFITPVFLHAGLIHYVLNMLAQLTASAQVGHRCASRKHRY